MYTVQVGRCQLDRGERERGGGDVWLRHDVMWFGVKMEIQTC